ncbi:tryptophan synthase subunit alpha [Halodesulfurarchaeum sp.]|uniref:tryptophan synthase subunit alpha n=1 Tax=Halodesulfurarchaeum sp. TaxID=1980530 RepID=UPI002FC3541B
MSKQSIREAFEGGALVPYLVAGDPTPEDTAEYAQALVNGGADVLELGLPFSEPVADGPTIQAGIRRALDAGMTPDRYLDLIDRLDLGVPLVAMTYYNMLFRYGDGDITEFVSEAAAVGLSGLIVPDLPVEESGALLEACAAQNIATVFIVAPTTTGDRLDRIVDRASGFLYVQARLGTTGARSDVSAHTGRSLDRLPETKTPTAVGFGVSTAEQAEQIVDAGADGVVAGSVFVDIIASGETVSNRLENKAAELAAGVRAGR